MHHLFAKVANYGRHMIYRGIGGGGTEKKLLALKWAQLEPKKCQNEDFSSF